MKKFLTMMCLALTFLFCGAAIACKDNKDNKDNGDSSALTVEESVSIELTKTYRLTPKINGEKADDVTYVSGDETIATVSKTGLISAKACGTTSITLTYEEKTATVDVTVALGETVPVLKLTEISDTEVNVYVGDELNLSATIGYGTKTYDDATISYKISDPTLGEMDGSKFTALAQGECEVEVSASWRNVPTTLKETVSVNIMETAGVEVLENVNVYYDGAFADQDLQTMFGATEVDILKADIKAVNEGDDLMSVELADNALSFKKDGAAYVADGTSFTMILSTATKQVEVQVTPCQKAFRTAADLDYFVEGSYEKSGTEEGAKERPSYGGYHVLVNDIDASQYTAKTKIFGSFNLQGKSSNEHHDAGFKGVFDGQGHKIDGLTVGAGGLFGVIGKGATVKNVGFTNAKLNVANGEKGGVLAGAIYHNAKVENVYIEVVDYGTTGDRASLAYAINNDAYLKNILIVDNDGIETAFPRTSGATSSESVAVPNSAALLALRTAILGQSTSKRRELVVTQWENVVMYSPSKMSILGSAGCMIWSLADRESLKGGDNGTKSDYPNISTYCAGLLGGTLRYTDWATLKGAYDANKDDSVTLYKNASGDATITANWNVKTSVDSFSSDFWAYDAATGALSWKGATA